MKDLPTAVASHLSAQVAVVIYVSHPVTPASGSGRERRKSRPDGVNVPLQHPGRGRGLPAPCQTPGSGRRLTLAKTLETTWKRPAVRSSGPRSSAAHQTLRCCRKDIQIKTIVAAFRADNDR